MRRWSRFHPWALILLAAIWAAALRAEDCGPIRQYIARGWTELARSDASLIESAADSKLGQSGRVVLYVPASEDPPRIAAELRRQLSLTEYARVTVRRLQKGSVPDEPGLLYLPHPYVVPGGRFNEMYGWDSYFIMLGLLEDEQVQLAKDMTDNLLYEVQHYGKVLNANRTYYLTRSQPPFLTRMVLDVFQRTRDVAWLKSALPPIEQYYAYWTREPHLTPETGLSRYYGGADTPAPEVVAGERDNAGRSEYDRVREYYRTHEVAEYDKAKFYDAAEDRLTPLFFVADRAMRESGFDPSARFGPFSAGILDYNPVALNSLLYRMETDLAAIQTLLNQPRQAEEWTKRAQKRAETINRLMWDDNRGLYFDYNFVKKARSGYAFLTTFYPLWAGIASPEQAARVAANLPLFERSGGLQTSTEVTGNQWDAPFGWAPLQIVATEGLRQYGFSDAADRVSEKFLRMVLRDFTEHGAIKEKYDVVAGKSDLAAGLRFGYQSNEIGFGWTNAAFLVMESELSRGPRQRVCAASATGQPQ